MKNLCKFFILIPLVIGIYNFSYAKGNFNSTNNSSSAKDKLLTDVQKNKDKYDKLAKDQDSKIEQSVNDKVNDSLSNLPKKYSDNLKRSQNDFLKEREKALQNAYQQGENIRKDVDKTIKNSYKNFRI